MHGGTNNGRARGGVSDRFARASRSLQAAVERSQGDQRLTDMTRQLEVLDAVMQRAIDRTGDNDTAGFRDQLRFMFERVRDLKDTPRVAALLFSNREGRKLVDWLDKAGDLIERGGAEDAALSALALQASRFQENLERFHRIRLARRTAMAAEDLVAIFQQMATVLVEELGKKMSPKDAQELTGVWMERVQLDLVGRSRDTESALEN